VIPEKLQDLRIPPSLTAVLQARLDSLPLAEKVTLQQAAVVGRVFWDTVLQVLQGESQTTIQVLKSISQRELIYPQPVPIIQDTHEFTFKNSLLRDVAYETVLKRVRQAYHSQVADWLVEALGNSGRVDEYSSVIAEHYAQAGVNTPAADWYTRAGERAKAQGTPLEARRFFDRALEFIPPTDQERRWRALIGREEVLGLLGESEARQQDDEELLALAQEMKDDNRLAEANYRLGYNAYSIGEDHLALKSYQASLEAALRAGNQRLQALVLALKVIIETRQGELNAAAQTAEGALILAETLGDDTITARVLTNLAVFYSESGDIARATKHYLQIAETTNRVDERFGQSIALSNLGYNYILLGLYDQAIITLNESIQLAESIGARHQSAFSRLNLGLAIFRNGDVDKARGELERVINELISMGDRFGQAASCTYLGLTLEALGEPASASRYYKNAEEIHNDIGVRGYACDARIGLARCLLSLGETEEAYQLAEYSWKELEVHGPTGIEFPIMLYKSCADIFEAIGHLENAQRAVEAGYTELMERARAISNPGWRKSYLENVHEHSMMIELWESLSSQETIQAIKGDNNGSRKEV
jgi:tetratricopeptide (TPR) repeat protein